MVKIFVFPVSLMGHMNPLTSLLQELGQNKEIEIICYAMPEYQEKIESIGAVYRREVPVELDKNSQISKRFYTLLQKSNEKNFEPAINAFRQQLEAADKLVSWMANEIESDRPNLIIYDKFALCFKMAIKYFKKYHKLSRLPPLIAFSPSFMIQKDIYPNKFESSLIRSPLSLRFICDICKASYENIKFSFKHGLELASISSYFIDQDMDAAFTMVAVFPDLQARYLICNFIDYIYEYFIFDYEIGLICLTANELNLLAPQQWQTRLMNDQARNLSCPY